jgi:hypothetical protein
MHCKSLFSSEVSCENNISDSAFRLFKIHCKPHITFQKIVVIEFKNCGVRPESTTWPEPYAIPHHEASTISEALVTNFFCCFGIPRELHSDQGRNFESHLL